MPTVGTTISVTSSMWLLRGSKTQHYSLKADARKEQTHITITGRDANKSLKYQKHSLVPKPHHVQAKPLAILHGPYPYFPWIFF